MNKKLTAAALLTAMALSAGSALAAKPLEKFAVTYVKAPLNVPSIVERTRRVFEKHFFGLPIEYSELTAGPEQTQALAAGDIHILNAVGATSVFLAAANGADIKILCMYSRSPEAFKLIGAKGSKIAKPQDLRGKTVAGPKGTILHELLVAWLAKGGMTEKDVNFVHMGIPGAQAALTAGEVQAALLAGPVAYTMEKGGFKVITSGKGLVNAAIVVASSGKFIMEHNEIINAFMNAQAEVLERIALSKEEMVKDVVEATGLTEDAVEAMYPLYDFSMDITEEDVEGMKKTVQFMVDNKMIDAPVNVEELIYNRKYRGLKLN